MGMTDEKKLEIVRLVFEQERASLERRVRDLAGSLEEAAKVLKGCPLTTSQDLARVVWTLRPVTREEVAQLPGKIEQLGSLLHLLEGLSDR